MCYAARLHDRKKQNGKQSPKGWRNKVVTIPIEATQCPPPPPLEDSQAPARNDLDLL